MPLYNPAAAGGSGNYTLITDSLLGADTASFDFTSIPASYKHLQIIVSARLTSAVTDDVITMRLNNDSSGNYDWIYQYDLNSSGVGGGNATAATSARVAEAAGASATTGRAGMCDIMIPDYASTTLWKMFSSQALRISGTGTNNLLVAHYGGMWRSTTAINRVTLLPGSGNLLAGSRATLYGLS